MAVIFELYNTMFFYNWYFSLLSLFFGFVIMYSSNNSIMFMKTLKNLILFSFSLSFSVFIIQFYLYLLLYNTYLCKLNLDFGGFLIILLFYIVGLISLITLNDRFWLLNKIYGILFLYFPVIIQLLVSTSNLLEMFLYYELLLLPSIFFVYGTGYTRKSQQANTYFFLWTQIGSLIVLFGVVCVLAITKNLDFYSLAVTKFTNTESTLVFTLFFIGFGVKVPIWPFHYWLTKVHVEAPSGFSIFLSGFLVKSAVYCFYKFTLFFFIHSFFLVFPIICIIGMLDSSIKMWGQTDIKKLIAYATIQEMNMIFILFTINDSNVIFGGFIFLFAHGVLSTLMFFIVELIYKRTHSRSIYKLGGLAELYPWLAIAVWSMLILFFGLPGTVKFFAEFFLLSIIVEFDIILGIVFGITIIFLGTLGFTKNWLGVLYGTPKIQRPTYDLTKEEIIVVSFLTVVSILPCFLLFIN